jgi:MFS transporter, DHA2 family, multidrug resistance protein
MSAESIAVPGTTSPQPSAPAAQRVPQAKVSASALTTHPFVGILGVFLGAGIATLNARLLSVGLPDLRGAMGLGVDEASWIPTALNAAMMFIGPFSVFLGMLFGPRRVLLPAAAIFITASILLPFSPNLSTMLILEVVAGLACGTFYPLTLTFVLRNLPKHLIIFGVAAYSMDIVFSSNIANTVQAWYQEHLSWHWIFWNAALITPLMMICVYLGVPGQPIPAKEARPNWRGFLYASFGFSLLFAALDQGERLDWFKSGVIVGLCAAGLLMLGAAVVRRWLQPNPMVNLAFLGKRNVFLLAAAIFFFKFVHLAAIVLIPSFLGNIQGYRALETGSALAWVAAPQFVFGWIVALLVIRFDTRVVMVAGFALLGVACWMGAHADASWAGFSFWHSDLLLAFGLSMAYVGMVGAIILQGLESGALTSAVNAATFSGWFHSIRIFGGQLGVAALTHFLSVREKFHSNRLGLNVSIGSWITEERLRTLAGGLLPHSSGLDEGQARSLGLLQAQVRKQAATLSDLDGFVLLEWSIVLFLVLAVFLKPFSANYRLLSKAD